MSPEVQAFASGFPLVLLHAGLSLTILVAGSCVYLVVSPLKEIARLASSDAGSAPLTLASAVLGLAIPLAVSLTASASSLEILLWGASLVVVTLGAFRLIDLALHVLGVDEKAVLGDKALLLAGVRIGFSLVLAAAVAG